MTGISNSPPARSWPTVDASRAQPRTDNELRAERETISQPRNVHVSGGGEALVNRQALLGTHRAFQAVMKQVDPTTARLQAPSSPMARAAAQALARPGPNLFERFAQAVSTAWHGYRADSAASSLAGQIRSGRFDAGSVDLLASLMQHASHLDPAAAEKARSHPAIALLQTKLAGADGATLDKVRNSPVFGELRAAAQARLAGQAAMLARLDAMGLIDNDPDPAPQAPPLASAGHAANRHLDRMQLILGHALHPDLSAGSAPKRLTVDPDDVATAATRIDDEVRAKWLAQVKSEHALPTAYTAAAALPASRLDNAKLGALDVQANNHATQGSALDRLAAQARVKLHQAPAQPSADTVRQRTLEAEHIARDGLTSLLRGMDGPTRRQELLQLAQGEGWLARGALHLLGEGNRVQAWDVAGRPEAVIFNGQSYEFDKQLGNGANGVALRYLPTGGGPGIVLKATRSPDYERLGEADGELLGKVGKEFANHMHAMGDGMQGHPNLLAVRGLIVAQAPATADVGQARNISLFTVMEEAGPGPEDLVKDINLLRLNGTISEATHGLMMRSLFAQMVEGCAHLEDRQIAHRDIKLENMLLSNDGRVLIMDLGEGDTGALLDPAPSAGSPLSMSPELLGGSRQAGKVDTWALGVVWRQMSNSRGEADPRDAAILNQRTNDGRVLRDGDHLGILELQNSRTAWTQDPGNAVHRPAALNEALVSGRTLGNLDGVEQLTNAMLHPDQAQRPTLAALRNHHAIADPALQDPRLRELIEAIQFKDTAEIARLDQALTALAGAAPIVPTPQSPASGASASGSADSAMPQATPVQAAASQAATPQAAAAQPPPKSADFLALSQQITTGEWATRADFQALEVLIAVHLPATERAELKRALVTEWNQRVANRPEVVALRQAERAAMGTRLGALGLQTHDVPGNGHCMFHAIAHQLDLALPGQADANAPQSAVRQLLLDYLNDGLNGDQGDYVAFESDPDMAIARLLETSDILETGINQSEVGRNGWGNDSHARLLALATGRPVLLMNPGGDVLYDPARLKRPANEPVTDAERQALMDAQPRPIVLIQNGGDHWQSTTSITP